MGILGTLYMNKTDERVLSLVCMLSVHEIIVHSNLFSLTFTVLFVHRRRHKVLYVLCC
jgi:hypothetical protein